MQQLVSIGAPGVTRVNARLRPVRFHRLIVDHPAPAKLPPTLDTFKVRIPAVFSKVKARSGLNRAGGRAYHLAGGSKPEVLLRIEYCLPINRSC